MALGVNVLHLNGTDGSTTITDDGSSPVAWTARHSAQIDTAVKDLGSGSLLCANATADYIDAVTGALPASGGWTVEFRYKFGTIASFSTYALFSQNNAAASANGALLNYTTSGTPHWQFNIYTDGGTNIVSQSVTHTPATSAFEHVAITYDPVDAAYYLYFNGHMAASSASPWWVNSSADKTFFGSNASFNTFEGWIDEVIISSECRYPGGTTFTPPAVEFGAASPNTYTEAGNVGALVGVVGEDTFVPAPVTYTEAGNVGALVGVVGEDTFHFGPHSVTEAGDVGVLVGVAAAMGATIYTEVGNVGVLAAPVSTHIYIDLVRVLVALTSPYRHAIKASLTGPYAYSIKAELTAPYGIVSPVKASLIAPYALTTAVRRTLAGVYDIAVVNRVRVGLRSNYALNETTIEVITEAPYAMAGTRRMEVAEASVSTEAGGLYWSARIRLASASDYYALARGDDLTLYIQGDEWDFVIESLSKNRSSRVNVSFDITCMSPGWLYMGEDEPITKTWPATSARDVVEELATQGVDWQIVDWTIPADRLAAVASERGDVAKQIAEAAGAVFESMPDGSLRVRYAYPVSLPDVPNAEPDYVLLEGSDIVSMSDQFNSKRVFNAVTLTDTDSQFGYLAADRDEFQQQDVLAGEQQRYIVWLDSRTQIVDTILSDGTLLDLGTRLDEMEETLAFDNTNSASTSKPIHSDLAWTWYGTGLGALTVGPDERSVVAASAGVGMVRVTYRALAHVFAVQAPATSGGRVEFPILVHIVGSVAEGGASVRRITVLRGDGDVPADDIVESLAGNEHVLLQRGRNYIDEQEQKRDVNMDVRYRGGYMKGQLVEVVDTMDGVTWRGQVSSVEHRCSKAKVVSALTVERFL